MNQQQSNSPSTPRKIALALQGGGSHGAFTWGVLDRMLEDKTIEIIGVTGTSAGAMNARIRKCPYLAGLDARIAR